MWMLDAVSVRLERSVDPKRPRRMLEERRSARRQGYSITPDRLDGGRCRRWLCKCQPHGNHKTVSTGLWKSRQEREIPTFAQPRLVSVKERRRTEDQRTTII